MARRAISAETKATVLAAANEQGPKHYDTIAKQFGVSVPTIYNWLNALKPVEVTNTEEVVSTASL